MILHNVWYVLFYLNACLLFVFTAPIPFVWGGGHSVRAELKEAAPFILAVWALSNTITIFLFSI